MDLVQKFQEVSNIETTQIRNLIINESYQIINAKKKKHTQYRISILLKLQDEDKQISFFFTKTFQHCFNRCRNTSVKFQGVLPYIQGDRCNYKGLYVVAK